MKGGIDMDSVGITIMAVISKVPYAHVLLGFLVYVIVMIPFIASDNRKNKNLLEKVDVKKPGKVYLFKRQVA